MNSTFIQQTTLLLALTLGLCSKLIAEATEYDFETIYGEREIPAWFNKDKFGIFVVWGPYSVPSYKKDGYAEWYWMETVRTPDTTAFHNRVYGEDFAYENFADMFTAELWDPDFWCDLFVASGAKYVVTTANYHDGFAMWPTEYAKTKDTDSWNSMERGPMRDIIGELNQAGEARGLKMGIYYSLYEWYHPLWLEDKERFATEWFHPKFKEVVTKYKPWHIFFDGEWHQDYKGWKSEELAHWLYNESPVKDTVVTNDRWGRVRGKWGDVYESEYGGGKYTRPDHPWQEDRGIGKSYGYNRTESIYDYDSRDELIRMFSGVVGGGGNFLLCVGPTADGRIPVIMQERLLQIGEWLKTNGVAIYGTTANPFWPRKFEWGTISKKPGKLFLHIHEPKMEQLKIKGIKAKVNSAQLLNVAGNQPVDFENDGNNLSFNWSKYLNDSAVTIIELDVDKGYEVDKTPRQSASGNIEFDCWTMEVHGDKAYPNYGGYQNQMFMRDWSDPEEYLTGEFIVETPGKYKVELIYAALEKKSKEEAGEQTGARRKRGNTPVGGQLTLQLGDNEQVVTIENVGSAVTPKPVSVGDVEFTRAGIHTFSLKPIDNENWKSFEFQGIRITPQVSLKQ
ncbi:alpha-L-fucosidase [Rubellicoccus peritrichatus]|uniref:alpha-L-fucosidase n=1 Tax=Rubellicoccus peritrichatus TaxID=3080537 RepID=A0AAQ3L8P4_9BACT|nr:alpha-L-fucosidase [Puniceicoccus sp. CR14]WOO41151.1 alpha-L-fucosidase [Puniceicoccus sp. CR14]